MTKLPRVELKEQPTINISKIITQIFYKDIERFVINKYKQMQCLDSPDTYKQIQNEIETIIQYCIASGYGIIYENEVKEVKSCTRCHKEISNMYDMLTGETYWVSGNIWKQNV